MTPTELHTLRIRAAAGDINARADLHRLGLVPLGRSVRTPGLSIDDAGAGVLVGETYVNPRSLSEADFVALVRRIRAGEVQRLRFRALVFVDKPNANLFRPKPGQIPALAASAPGALYLVGHRQFHEESRVGDVVAGAAGEHEGNAALLLDIDITDPEAQERFLRGQQDRFSIGWDADGAECSVCGDTLEWDWWDGWCGEDCDHEFGETYDGTLCELFYTGCALDEVSTVNFPAVSGTSILSRLSRPAESNVGATPKVTTMPKKTDSETDLRTENEALKAQLDSMNEQQFQRLFKQGLDECRVNPADLDEQRAVFNALGAERFERHLASRQPDPRFAGVALGEVVGPPDSFADCGHRLSAPRDVPRRATSFVESAARRGFLKSVTPEAIKRAGVDMGLFDS